MIYSFNDRARKNQIEDIMDNDFIIEDTAVELITDRRIRIMNRIKNVRIGNGITANVDCRDKSIGIIRFNIRHIEIGTATLDYSDLMD